VRIGIFGGTFNPPHLGHLICAQEAHLQLELDRVIFMPAAEPPHKPVPDDPGPEHRLELCRLAVAGDEQRFEVSDLEVVRAGTSFTVDTLEELSTSFPDSDLFLILGGDVAAGLPHWREPERILALATPALADRPGTPDHAVTQALCTLPGGDRARHFKMPTIDISSTVIRRRAAAGQSIRYLVPDPVATYIGSHRLYQEIE
jgi:nicotinate-nucleotide adenylyltransferase